MYKTITWVLLSSSCFVILQIHKCWVLRIGWLLYMIGIWWQYGSLNYCSAFGHPNLIGHPQGEWASKPKGPPISPLKLTFESWKSLDFIHILTWSFSSNCVSYWVTLVIHESTLWLEAMSSKKCLAWGQMAGRCGVGWLKSRNSTGPRDVYYTVVLGLGWRTCTQLSFPKRCSKDR